MPPEIDFKRTVKDFTSTRKDMNRSVLCFNRFSNRRKEGLLKGAKIMNKGYEGNPPRNRKINSYYSWSRSRTKSYQILS